MLSGEEFQHTDLSTVVLFDGGESHTFSGAETRFVGGGEARTFGGGEAVILFGLKHKCAQC